jgi:hydroxymethylbilane synthase
MAVTNASSRYVLGTRGSPLALAQANEAARLLRAALALDEDGVGIKTIKTSGDTIVDRALSEAGGKGLFTKELDSALMAGDIDFAVHSAKDMPTVLPDAIVIAGYLPREDVRDVFVSARADSIAALPPGATIGSASLRRQAQVRRLRPDLTVALLRGNVGTRLDKVMRGEVDATLLALAGLRRLGLAKRATAILDTDVILPAVGQGAIAITARTDDTATRDALLRITHPETGVAVTTERAFLGVLDGSCRTPIAGLAEVQSGTLSFRGLVLAPDGSDAVEVARQGPLSDASELGADAAREIVARARPTLFGR